MMSYLVKKCPCTKLKSLAEKFDSKVKWNFTIGTLIDGYFIICVAVFIELRHNILLGFYPNEGDTIDQTESTESRQLRKSAGDSTELEFTQLVDSDSWSDA